MTDYFNPDPLKVAAHTLVRASQFNDALQAIDDAFAQIPDVTTFNTGLLLSAVATGTGDAIELAPDAGEQITYQDRQMFGFYAIAPNTGPATVNVSDIGPVTLRRYDGSALQVGDIVAGQFVIVGKNPTQFRLAGAHGASEARASASAAAAAQSAADAAASAAAAAASAATAAGAANTVMLKAQNLNDVADKATARENLGVKIGTNVQAQNNNLQSLAGSSGAANNLIYFSALNTIGLSSLTAAGRDLLDDADATAQRNTLGMSLVQNRGVYVQAGDPGAVGSGDLWVW